MDLGLEGSAAVVTGGSKGMGRAIAEAFADDGARVASSPAGPTRSTTPSHELRRRGSPDAVGLSVDLTDPAAIDDAFAEIGERWGAVNSLVNTLGPATATSRTSTTPAGTRRSSSGSWPPSAAPGPRCRCCGPPSGLAS